MVGFLTRDEIVAILLGGGPEHLDRTARLRASAHDAWDLRVTIMTGLRDQELTETGCAILNNITPKSNVLRLAAVCSKFASARIRHVLP